MITSTPLNYGQFCRHENLPPYRFLCLHEHSASKGRWASRMLKPLLARLAATLLAWDVYLVIVHHESSENPTTMPVVPSGWPGQASRLDRRRAREAIVLEEVGITAATLERYYTAVARMLPILDDVMTEVSLDEAIADWIQEEFSDGSPLHLTGDALSGIHHLEPSTRRKLPKAWRLYSIWRRYKVPCRAPRLTQDITLPMAGWCIEAQELTIGALLAASRVSLPFTHWRNPSGQTV